jgi:uracil-DNA glycosylase
LNRLAGRTDTLHTFVCAVAALRFEHCFNPYTDRCAVHDHHDGPARRAAVLSAIISRAVVDGVDAVWIGRDLGHRGGRRTGLALTDDVHAGDHARRWNVEVERPTVGAVVAERTAAVVWNMLERIEARTFLWNVFPLHPHKPDDPFTNRQHNVRERHAGEDLLADLIALVRPARLIAIGNDAVASAVRISGKIPVVRVRHPSYGGQTQFVQQIEDIYPLARNRRLL